MKPMPLPKHRSTTPQPVVAGLSSDALARLTPEQISARSQAAKERAAAATRKNVSRALATRVAVVPKPKPKPKAKTNAKPKLRQRPVPAPATPLRPALAHTDYTTAQADLLVRLANTYDAGQPMPVGLTPEEIAVAVRHGRRLRSERQKF